MSFIYQNPQNFAKPHTKNFMLSSETPTKTTYPTDKQPQLNENNNQLSPNGNEKTLKELWSKHKMKMSKIKTDSTINIDNKKMTWDVDKPSEALVQFEELEEPKQEEIPVVKTEEPLDNTKDEKEESPSHHARRPPNAFLIFCKKHRPIVREKFVHLENRGVTKILGEWWALLSAAEKLPYNDLAKEYKDAFLSANPDFRWYKLPAPPLRTLNTRPITATKPHLPISSPSNNTSTLTSPIPEFTPGKLADESQLGGLTSLMNNFVSTPKTEPESNNNVLKPEKFDETFISPVYTTKVTTPPKPIKKRYFEYFESKDCVRNLMNDIEANQEVGGIMLQDASKAMEVSPAKYQDSFPDSNGLKEPRKSERMCKGKRYEKFMVEGKLLGNKKDTRFIYQRQTRHDSRMDEEMNILEKPETPKLDLGNTIKRLAERTNIKNDFDNDVATETDVEPEIKRVRSISETSENGGKNGPPNFNLDLRIANLPSLSYAEFTQRKRDSKKRKARSKSEGDHRKKIQKTNKDTQLVGSKKRKNKQSITHLGNKTDSNLSNDLLGLATLAEVAANTEKINEKISE
ncbi:uncharacterized protein bbx [Diabrotica undecimpunctata]|uniref:uncharacterized protein bbx n=1 Tax=Diabrotica undecimpunctata TaxID=50387 RepID=UPI003B63AA7F